MSDVTLPVDYITGSPDGPMVGPYMTPEEEIHKIEAQEQWLTSEEERIKLMKDELKEKKAKAEARKAEGGAAAAAGSHRAEDRSGSASSTTTSAEGEHHTRGRV